MSPRAQRAGAIRVRCGSVVGDYTGAKGMKRLSMRVRTVIVAAVAMAAAGTGTAIAASSDNLTTSKSGKPGPGQTKTFKVAHIDATAYASKYYTGTVKIILPKSGRKPSLRLVKIKQKGNGAHATYYAATVENTNKSGTALVTVKLTATTHVTQCYARLLRHRVEAGTPRPS
jgi:hypothetical protein